MNCELTKESRIGDKVFWSNKDGTFEGKLVNWHRWSVCGEDRTVENNMAIIQPPDNVDLMGVHCEPTLTLMSFG